MHWNLEANKWQLPTVASARQIFRPGWIFNAMMRLAPQILRIPLEMGINTCTLCLAPKKAYRSVKTVKNCQTNFPPRVDQ